jgi:anti-anti-sigma factor
VAFQISIRESAGVTVLDLRGRLTIDGESEMLSTRLKKLVASGVRKLLLNMADLKQVDSSGVSVIIDSYVSLRNKGGEIKLLHPRGPVLEVFRVLRLLEIIPSFDDETQALASFQPRGYAAAP